MKAKLVNMYMMGLSRHRWSDNVAQLAEGLSSVLSLSEFESQDHINQVGAAGL